VTFPGLAGFLGRLGGVFDSLRLDIFWPFRLDYTACSDSIGCMMRDLPKHTKTMPVRIPPELLDRLDAARRETLTSREAYVRMLLDKALTAEERKAERSKQ